MPLLEELDYMPTEKYAHSKELLKHAELIGRHWDLYSKALFQTEVHSITWDEETKNWLTRTSRGDTIRSKYVVPAAGPLHRPKLPGLPVEKFRGHSFHSGRWDYKYTGESCSLHPLVFSLSLLALTFSLLVSSRIVLKLTVFTQAVTTSAILRDYRTSELQLLERELQQFKSCPISQIMLKKSTSISGRLAPLMSGGTLRPIQNGPSL